MHLSSKYQGVRELKKERTRGLIAEVAWKLFADRGFDEVTVAEIAREAIVSTATVFNYFATKEDLFFFRLESFGDKLVDAVRVRPSGEPALTGFRRFLLQPGGLLAQLDAGDPRAIERLRTIHRVIAASPALLAREHLALVRNAEAFAELLVTDTGASPNSIGPHVAAHALIGVQRALIDLVRRRVLADDQLEQLAKDVRIQGEAAFALLAGGLEAYAPKS